jgi:hypothetical protein
MITTMCLILWMPWVVLPAAVLVLLLAAGLAPVQAARVTRAVPARTPNLRILARGALITMRAVKTPMLGGLIQDAERSAQCCYALPVGLP